VNKIEWKIDFRLLAAKRVKKVGDMKDSFLE
jgi:hypothetical protein